MLLQISDEDIRYAELILFEKVSVFDKERIDFIKNLDTCDLQAVPGSGKTTALLAKLLILEKYLPLGNNRGLLVLSHTNAAINEIKHKIEKYCPKLFVYPNFVGTIQSFIDEFLAKPFYLNHFKKRISRIDNDLFEENASKFSTFFFSGFTTQEQNNAKSFLRVNDLYKQLRYTHSESGDIKMTRGYFGSEINIRKPKGTTKPENYKDWGDNEKHRVNEWLKNFRKKLIKDGYICYDDAYFLGFEYLRKYPAIKRILQLRFNYVFVDEMQDMDKHQYEILERLFWDDKKSISIYQRIGDKNQSIFNPESTFEDIWIDRNIVLEFTESHRLPNIIAKVVERLALRPIAVVGKRKNPDGSEINIKPHLIVYDNLSIEKVLPRFARICKQFADSGQISLTSQHPIKAICWNTQPEEEKIRLPNYFPRFSKQEQKLSVNYSCLEAYLHLYDKSEKSFATIRKNILNSFLKILRLEGVIEIHGKPITKRRILDFLEKDHFGEWEDLKSKIYCWCLQIIKGKEDLVIADIRKYIPKFLSFFKKNITHCKTFIEEVYSHSTYITYTSTQNPTRINNVFSENGITIEIGTVHSIKGQTHIATLYMESFYQRSVQNLGNYESERLHMQLKGHPLPVDAHEYIKQSMKMTYVGFSRPTHLLCFAVHKNRYDAKLGDIENEGWEVVYV